MIDLKQAIQVAKASAAEFFEGASSLEEIERETYKSRNVWAITLSVLRKGDLLFAIGGSADPARYKRFFIDEENGELVAVTLRETASA